MTNPSNATDDDGRLRPHPIDRAIDTSQIIDLAAALERLRAEEHPAPQGHRQVTLFHRSPVTMVLFAFTAEGVLPNHQAKGVVTIQVLEGSVTIQADATDYVVNRDQVLVLNPGTPHSVQALQPTAMLLTVHHEAASTKE